MPRYIQHEDGLIEARARRINRRRDGLPWHSMAPGDHDDLRHEAELALCQEGALPSHRFCRGDHEAFEESE